MKHLAEIIRTQKLSKSELAKALFPQVGFPLMALDRVLNGQRELSVMECRVLSEITSIPIGFLVSDSWRSYPSNSDEISFLKGDVIVKLNVKKWLTVVHIFRDGAYQPTFNFETKNVPLSVYLDDITSMVISQTQV